MKRNDCSEICNKGGIYDFAKYKKRRYHVKGKLLREDS